MIAIDTNVLVRLITGDNKDQAVRAAAFLRAQPAVFLPKTVVLELEWVLRSAYGYHQAQITGAIRAIATMPNVEIEDEAAVMGALEWADQGLDLADSLHLASAGPHRRFATFDARLAVVAKQLRIGEVVQL